MSAIQAIVEQIRLLPESEQLEIVYRVLDEMPNRGIGVEDDEFLEEMHRRANENVKCIPWK